MTVSAGVRWEYYPLSQRRDRGLEVFDFTARQLLICGQAGIPQTCGVTVEKNLFTPRLGWAYRPTDSTVIRVGYSRNPQNDTSGREQMPPFNAYPATIIYTETAPNTYTAIGTLARRVPDGAGPGSDRRASEPGQRRAHHVSAERAVRARDDLVLEREHAAVAPVRATASRWAMWQIARTASRASVNQNYGRLGGGTASQPYSSITTSSINIQAPAGKVKYDSLQASVNKRMTSGLQYSVAYTYAQDDRLVGRHDPAAGVLVPE